MRLIKLIDFQPVIAAILLFPCGTILSWCAKDFSPLERQTIEQGQSFGTVQVPLYAMIKAST